MTILFTASRISHFVQFHSSFFDYYTQKGYSVHLAAEGTSNFSAPVVQHDITFNKQNLIKNIKSFLRLRRIIKMHKIDVVISNATLAGLLTRLAVMTLFKKPVVIHSSHGYLFCKNTPKFKKALYILVEKILSPVTNLAVTMNKEDFDSAQKYHFAKKIINIPGMGITFCTHCNAKETLRQKLNLKNDDFLLLYAGEFSKRKNQEGLIKLIANFFKANAHVHLLLAGTGARLEACKNLVKELCLEQNVHFVGFIKEKNLLYSNIDTVISNSKSEGLPFNIMEALYQGICVVATKVKGHNDLIIDGKNGLLYEENNEKELLQKLNALIGTSAQKNDACLLRQNLSACAKDFAKAYTKDAVFESVLKAYSIADNRLL